MTKKYYIIGALVVIAAVLLYFLLREPKPIDTHTDDYDRIVAENKSFKEHEAIKQKVIDSLELSGRSKDSIITALQADKNAKQKEIDKNNASISRLAKEVKELRKGDTSEFARKCDSIAEQAASFEFLFREYKDYSDSLFTIMDSQKGDYVKALEEQKKLYTELKRKHDELLQAYDQLYKEYSRAWKTVRRERLKTKVAALLGLVGAGVIILK